MHLGNGLRSGWLNPLLNGVSTVYLPEVDVDAFFSALEQYQPTCLNAGFALLRAILRRVPDYRSAVAQSRLRFLRAGLGRLDSDEIEGLEQAFGAPLLGGFSSTETTSIAHDPLPPRPRKRARWDFPGQRSCDHGQLRRDRRRSRQRRDRGPRPLVFAVISTIRSSRPRRSQASGFAPAIWDISTRTDISISPDASKRSSTAVEKRSRRSRSTWRCSLCRA